MFQLNHILAVVDFRQSKHFALPRAIEYSKQFGGKVTILANCYEGFMDFIPSSSSIDHDKIKAEAIKQNKKKLEELVDGIDHQEVDLELEILWSKSLHDGLIDYVNKNDFDLVVKTAHRHNPLEKLLFTPTDWHLLRDTQTNLLFVKKNQWTNRKGVLGAINIEDDEKHRKLNKRIINTTVELADAAQCKANIINTFPWPMVQLDKFKYLFDNQDPFLTIKETHAKSVNNFVNSVTEFKGNIIIGEGLEPEETIPKLAKSTHSSLLVMGSVGRKGIEAVIVGNTAEKILDELECEVLVLK